MRVIYKKLKISMNPYQLYSLVQREHSESFLLESIEGGEHLSRYSFVGCNPRAVIRQFGNQVEVTENGRSVARHTVTPGAAGPGTVKDGLAVVEQVLAQYRAVDVPGLPRFTGGAVGFIGYEFIHDVEPVVPRPPRDELGTPVMYWLIVDKLLIFDRVAQTLTVLVNAFVESPARAEAAYDQAIAEIIRLVGLLRQPLEHSPATVPVELPFLPFESNQPKEKFLANVLEAKKYITAGDIIQIVGSQRFATRTGAAALDVYRADEAVLRDI